MKKQYVTPRVAEHSFEFRDGIAIPFDPAQSTGEALGKGRDDENDDDIFAGDPEWENGLW